MIDSTETIVAIGSPPGQSGRGLVRVSGVDLRPLLEALVGDVPKERVLTPMRVRGLLAEADDLSLPCLMLYFRGPNSFTGQDVLEIQVVGNPFLLTQLVERILVLLRPSLENGPSIHPNLSMGRMAEAGEFTRRALTSGRIDLTEAEGIHATITAVCAAQLRAAGWLRSGTLGQWTHALVDRLGQSLGLVEAGIDFVDQEDVVAIAPDDLMRQLVDLKKTLDDILVQSRSWSSLEVIPQVVLAGPANAGKSTLFNRLLGHQRAVTCDQAGTTRDILKSCWSLGQRESEAIDGAVGLATDATSDRMEVMLSDLAGFESTWQALPDDQAVLSGRQALTHQMRRQAHKAIEQADLILWCQPAVAVPGCDDDHWPAILEGRPVIRVITQIDRLDGEIAASMPMDDKGSVDDAVLVSGQRGEGLDRLRQVVRDRLAGQLASETGERWALQPRHQDELNGAVAAIERAKALTLPSVGQRGLASMELIAVEMRIALDHLASLGGAMTPDDVLGKVFSTFCVGK